MYKFNPHKHVKIWLSKDQDVFMNQENQLRLVHMRTLNPQDDIHLIYAKTLLTAESEIKLKDFCNKHNIIALALEEEITSNCRDEELELLNLCKQEIAAFGNGGSLAAASDILRWLHSVYSLGVYSDLDVTPNTHSLPQEIEVDRPLLLNIGSIEQTITGLNKNDLENIALNNDVLAILDDDPIISKIQQYIIHAYNTPTVYSEYFERLGNDWNHYITLQIGAIRGALTAATMLQPLAIFSDKLFEISVSKNMNPITLRQELNQMLQCDNSLYSYNIMQTINPENVTEENSIKLHADWLRLIHQHSQTAGKTDNELITFDKENQNNAMFRETVIAVTGPKAVIMSLFNNAALTAEQIDNTITPYTFQQYNLSKEFYSSNSFPLHAKISDVLIKSSGTIGSAGDQSWLKMGAQGVIKREQNMNQCATKIAAAYKGHMFRSRLVKEAEASSQSNPSLI